MKDLEKVKFITEDDQEYVLLFNTVIVSWFKIFICTCWNFTAPFENNLLQCLYYGVNYFS